MFRSIPWRQLAIVVAIAAGPSSATADDVRPLPGIADHEAAIQALQRHCVRCHGPFRAEAELRLDDPATRWESLFERGLFPGIDGSQGLIRDVLAAGGSSSDATMPPDRPIAEEDRQTLLSWASRAERDAPPDAIATSSSSPVDDWITSPLKVEDPLKEVPANETDTAANATSSSEGAAGDSSGLSATDADSSESRMRRLRRLSLTLTGLPPEPQELRDFAVDARPDALSRQADRLVASPTYAERWGRFWLDQARYGDTEGFDIDQPRPHAWRYRTWVIESLNRDLPYDRFSRAQLAGDLDATEPDSIVATGFYVQTPRNTEAGADREEDRVRRGFDRIETIADIWLGVGLRCARCHDHPGQPFTQRDYYGWFALVRNLDDRLRTAPTERVLDDYARAAPSFEERRAKLMSSRDGYRQRVARPEFLHWLAAEELTRRPEWKTLQPESAEATSGEELSILEDGSVMATGPLPDSAEYRLEGTFPETTLTAIRLEALPDPQLPHGGPGRAPDGSFDVSRLWIRVRRAANPDRTEPVSLLAPWTTRNDGTADLTTVVKEPGSGERVRSIGWLVTEPRGERQVLVAELERPLSMAPGDRLEVVVLQSQDTWMKTLGRLRIAGTSVPTPFTDPDLASQPWSGVSDRTLLSESQETFEHYLLRDEHDRRLGEALATLERLWPERPDSIWCEAIGDSETFRPTVLYSRGEYEAPGEAVEASLPTMLRERFGGETTDRRGLADWLFDEATPLVARVTAARLLQRLADTRIIDPAAADPWSVAVEHREQVDRFARRLIDQEWSLKGTLRRAAIDEIEYGTADRRTRLEAEMIRDSLLAGSGLLVSHFGGKSIVQPQPLGRSEGAFSRAEVLSPAVGRLRYVRGTYVWWQRTSPFPLLAQFGTPTTATCTTERETVDTAQQAMTLLNDPQVHDQTRHVALRAWLAGLDAEAPETVRLDELSLLLLGRSPRPEESRALLQLVAEHVDFYRVNPELVDAVLEGMLHHPESTDHRASLAAWIMLARVIVNSPDFLAY